MRRSYRRDRYLGILDRVRAAMPEAAITTDIIVGFPGETDADFADTMDVVERARFAGAFTFVYSKRPGTPAAAMTDEVPAEVIKERYAALVDRVNQIAWEENQRFEGREVEVLVAAGEGRKDLATQRVSGRAKDNRLVHVTPGDMHLRPGDLVVTEVTHAAPHHLVSDLPVRSVRRTRAGDAWSALAGGTDSAGRPLVRLGMPSVGPPVVETAPQPRC
jgi:tRNA-2-methylthio-N6-dimethylallyladenosine synthase